MKRTYVNKSALFYYYIKQTLFLVNRTESYYYIYLIYLIYMYIVSAFNGY